MADAAHKWTDKKIKQLERRLNQEYEEAIKEVEETTADYFRRFEIKDKKWRQWVDEGKKTEAEYQQWRFGQMAVGDRWEELKERLAVDYHNVNERAKELSRNAQLGVYSENYNYSTYQIEKESGLDTNFTLYNKEAVEQILVEEPDLLPQPGKKTSSSIAAGLDIQWNKQLVQSAVIQGIMQGMSIPKLATKLAEKVGDNNRKSAIRNARTMMTGAQNAARVESYKRAQKMGIDLMQEWVATLDGRTRHEHRLLDGQRVEVGKPFEVEGQTIRFPGDPQAHPRLVYNCRCTLISQIKGFEIDSRAYRQDPDLEGMTYEEWKHAKAKSNSITLPEEKAEKIKQSYINEYRNDGLRKIRSISGEEDNRLTSNLLRNSEVVKTAQNYAFKEFGISYKGFDNSSIEFISTLNKEIEKIYNEFGDLSRKGVLKTVQVVSEKFPHEAAYLPYSNTISFKKNVVENADGLERMEKIAKANYNYGFWSTGAAEHSMRHELGHSIEKSLETNLKVDDELTALREKLKQKYNINDIVEDFNNPDGSVNREELKKCKAVGKEFSYYGLEDNGEMIAEAIAEYMNGEPRPITKEIIRIIKKGM